MRSKKTAPQKIFILLATAVVGVLFLNQGVFALSADQRSLFNLGVYQFDVESGVSNTVSCGSASINLKGDSNAAKAMNFFIGQGLTDYQAAGIVGNLAGESGIIPNRKQGGPGVLTISSFNEVTANVGYGIAQWTTGDRQKNWGEFAEKKNMDPLSLELQLLFLWNELQTTADYGYEHIVDAKDLRQATWIFLAFFERPASVTGLTGNPTQPTGGSAKAALDERVRLATETTGIANSGSGTSSPSTPVSTSLEACDTSASAGGGVKYSANGYTFPLQTSRETILAEKPAPWCATNPTSCHHNYNAADMFAPTGTPVLAMRGGRVVAAKDNRTDPSQVGTRVTIMGDDNFLYYYAHMGDGTLKVRDGQQIAAGTEIGRVGTDANAVGTDAHVHVDRLPGDQYPSRPICSGAACSGYPFDDIQVVLSELFKGVK